MSKPTATSNAERIAVLEQQVADLTRTVAKLTARTASPQMRSAADRTTQHMEWLAKSNAAREEAMRLGRSVKLT